jgi:hypothetical protein
MVTMNISKELITKGNFKCYLCNIKTKLSDRGAILNSSGILPEEICSKCVHKNYCWATIKDLSEHNYTEIEERRRSLIGNI